MGLLFQYQKMPIYGGEATRVFIARPYIPVYLISRTKRTPSPYYALLDSGADRVIFPADLANAVGIEDIKYNARYEPTIGIGKQSVEVYFHKLAIKVLGEDRELSTEIGFANNFTVPILGRSFFRHYKAVIFEEAKERVELKL